PPYTSTGFSATQSLWCLLFALIQQALVRRFPTPIWEFFELRANFLPKNLPSTPITLAPLTVEPLQYPLNFPTGGINNG
ncbi:hypothetical protein, partial [Microcoleus sp. F4-D5]|uniref:hypothetical protein n=1 Tax=Microcoleus sp. F4-D5 TaxID=2818760 RepID=UPI002FD459C3